MTRVTLGKSRVREIRPPGSVRAKAEWLSYSTATRLIKPRLFQSGGRGELIISPKSRFWRQNCTVQCHAFEMLRKRKGSQNWIVSAFGQTAGSVLPALHLRLIFQKQKPVPERDHEGEQK